MLSRVQFWVFSAFLALTSVSAIGFELVLAKVSSDSKKGITQLAPMVEFVAKELGDVGVSSGQVRLFASGDALAKAMLAGEVHWVTETALNAATLMREADATPIALKWKKGQANYRSVIFTRRDSTIASLNDLKGKAIAFEDDSSFSSYYLPRLLIEAQGLELNFMRSLNDKKKPEAVNYVFARTEKNIAMWVEKGLVSAGALNSNDWDSPKRVLPESRAKLRQLHVSEPYPRAYELVSAALPGDVRKALKHLLLTMTSENYASVLEAYEKTTQFDAVKPKHLEQLRVVGEQVAQW